MDNARPTAAPLDACLVRNLRFQLHVLRRTICQPPSGVKLGSPWPQLGGVCGSLGSFADWPGLVLASNRPHRWLVAGVYGEKYKRAISGIADLLDAIASRCGAVGRIAPSEGVVPVEHRFPVYTLQPIVHRAFGT